MKGFGMYGFLGYMKREEWIQVYICPKNPEAILYIMYIPPKTPRFILRPFSSSLNPSTHLSIPPSLTIHTSSHPINITPTPNTPYHAPSYHTYPVPFFFPLPPLTSRGVHSSKLKPPPPPQLRYEQVRHRIYSKETRDDGCRDGV